MWLQGWKAGMAFVLALAWGATASAAPIDLRFDTEGSGKAWEMSFTQDGLTATVTAGDEDGNRRQVTWSGLGLGVYKNEVGGFWRSSPVLFQPLAPVVWND